MSDQGRWGAAVWGAPTWGHVVSSDLAHWQQLPVALQPDTVYDNNGVFSGSATVVNGTPILLYTGAALCPCVLCCNRGHVSLLPGTVLLGIVLPGWSPCNCELTSDTVFHLRVLIYAVTSLTEAISRVSRCYTL